MKPDHFKSILCDRYFNKILMLSYLPRVIKYCKYNFAQNSDNSITTLRNKYEVT